MNMNNTATYIYKELKRREVPVEIISEQNSLLRYLHNDQWRMLKSCITDKASYPSCHICNTKTLAEIMAKSIDMPVPASTRHESLEESEKFMRKHQAIVVKPVDAAHGHGVSINIRSKTELKKALAAVKKYSKEPAILQQMVKGKDVRILVIDGKFVAAVSRVPATVTGDGKHTIQELIEMENKSPHRKDPSVKMRGRLAIINLSSARAYLKRKISRVPKAGEKVPVVGVGNTSLGGHAEDVTDEIPAKIYQKAEAFARKLHLPVCGVDILLDDNGQYHFLEANAAPGFGPHQHPVVGKSRDVTKIFVDMLLK